MTEVSFLPFGVCVNIMLNLSNVFLKLVVYPAVSVPEKLPALEVNLMLEFITFSINLFTPRSVLHVVIM